MKKERGFLLIVAVVIIVLFSLFSASLVSMFLRSTRASNALQSIKKASNLAESGLEQGLSNLTQSTLASRQSCTNLSATNSIATGNFVVSDATDTANSVNPRYAYATLSTAISSTSSPSTISVDSTTNFASRGGRVLIGREVFKYLRVLNSTTLTGISRAQDGSLASSHVIGELVSQYQCTMSSIGNAPATSPFGIREYQQGVQQPVLFAVGNGGTILRWNGSGSELAWQSFSSGASRNNYAISAINYHSAWAVSAAQSNDYFTFSRLLGTTWSAVTNLDKNNASDLNSVSTVSENEAWAVGNLEGNNLRILRWIRNASNTSANWCKLACSGKTVSETGLVNATKDLFAVEALDTDGDGFANVGCAAGGQDGTSATSANLGIVMYYNGTLWSPLSLPSSSIGRIYGLNMVPYGNNTPREAFFVGRSSALLSASGKIVRLRDGVWSVVNTTNILRSVSVIDTDGDGLANYGIAVGLGGAVYTYNGSTWSTVTPFSSNDLYAVKVLSPTSSWMVGTNGTRLYYNGTSLVSAATGVTTSQTLTGISAIYPQQSALSSWYDVIN